jgi:hypothetical protein
MAEPQQIRKNDPCHSVFGGRESEVYLLSLPVPFVKGMLEGVARPVIALLWDILECHFVDVRRIFDSVRRPNAALLAPTEAIFESPCLLARFDAFDTGHLVGTIWTGESGQVNHEGFPD